MALVEVKVPQLSESVAEATMLTWKKKVGESVAVGLMILTPADLRLSVRSDS